MSQSAESNEDYTMDISLIENSSKWLLNNNYNNYHDKKHVNYITDSIYYLNELKYIHELSRPVPPLVNNDNNHIPFPRFLKVTTIIRLVLLVTLFRRGFKGKFFLFYIIGAICFYLYDSGLAKYLISLYINRRLDQRRLNNNNNNQHPNDLFDVLYHISQNGVAIPMQPGVIYDFLSISIGFICSLFPAWLPTI